MSLALHQIDANHFSQGWLAKIKNDVPSDNKHLKANNLRKIIAAIVEFNESVVHFVKLPDFPLPNVNAAAEGQREEIGISFLLLPGVQISFSWIHSPDLLPISRRFENFSSKTCLDTLYSVYYMHICWCTTWFP